MTERKILSVCVWLVSKFSLDFLDLRMFFVASPIFGFDSSVIIYSVFSKIK